VELAAEIHHTWCEIRNYGGNLFPEQLQIVIMEGGKRILGGGPESLSKFATSELKERHIEVRTDCFIKSVNKEGFTLNDGSLISADIKIWTAGIKAPDWLSKIGLSVNDLNQIKVNEQLQSLEDVNVMALGDCAFCPDTTGNPGKYLAATAQVSSSSDFAFRFPSSCPVTDPVPFLSSFRLHINKQNG